MRMTGGARRHQPLRYNLGGDEPHPPWVPVPKATHILRGQVPKYCCFVGIAPGQSSVSVSVSAYKYLCLYLNLYVYLYPYLYLILYMYPYVYLYPYLYLILYLYLHLHQK